MTNKQKAKELAELLVDNDRNQVPLINVLMKMAQWKDEQICQFFNFVRPYLPAHIIAEAKKMLNIKH